MEKPSVIYLSHILDCIARIRTYTDNIEEQDFLNSPLIQDAVIRNFEVIGEATKKVDSTIKEQCPEIPWKNIAGMRDKLIHNYMGVDLEAVWGVVEDILPDFEKQIKNIINNLSK